MGNDTDGFWLMHSVRLCWTSGSAASNSPNTGAANQRAKENCRKGTTLWIKDLLRQLPFFFSLCIWKHVALYFALLPSTSGCDNHKPKVVYVCHLYSAFAFLFFFCWLSVWKRYAVHPHVSFSECMCTNCASRIFLGHPQRCLAGCWSWCHCAQLLFSRLAWQRTCCPTERVQHRNG